MVAVLAVAAVLFFAGHSWHAAGLLAVAAVGPHAHNWAEAAWWAATWRFRLAAVLIPSAVAGAVFVSGWLALTLAAGGAWRVLVAALRKRDRSAVAVPVAVVNNYVTVNNTHHRHYPHAPAARRARPPLVLALSIGRRTTSAPTGDAIDVTDRAPAALTGSLAALPPSTSDDAIPAAIATTAQEARP